MKAVQQHFRSAFLKILGLPFGILAVIIKYFTGKTGFRKFENRLKICIKLVIYRFGILLPIKDSSFLAFSNTKVFKLFKLVAKSEVRTLPSYGEKYGTCGIWFAKAPERKTSDPIIIYLHGGGYYLQTQVEQLKSLAAVYKSVNANKNLSILFLDYDLVSLGHKFPRQLRQLHSVYTKLLEDGNDNLILLGDSAGGHLSISYTEYLKRFDGLYQAPRKLLLISPWVDLAVNETDYSPGQSYYDNQKRDLIDYILFLGESAKHFMDDKNRNHHEYFHWSYKAPVDWDKNPFFNNSNGEVFLVYGEDESFRDHIHKLVGDIYGTKPITTLGASNNKLLPEFESKIEVKNRPKLLSYVEPWGVHDALFFIEYDIIGKYRNFDQLDDEKYFSFIRIVNYLNQSL